MRVSVDVVSPAASSHSESDWKLMIERIHSLAPSPYRYGSELALPQFPRFNDLGLFAEFAVANTVMEEPVLRREPGLEF